MKRILLSICILATTCTMALAQNEQAPVPTKASLTAKANALDAAIAANNVAAENTTWDELHPMLIAQLGACKMHIAQATSEADKAAYTTKMHDERDLYQAIFKMHDNLAANRTALHTKLLAFANTIN